MKFPKIALGILFILFSFPAFAQVNSGSEMIWCSLQTQGISSLTYRDQPTHTPTAPTYSWKQINLGMRLEIFQSGNHLPKNKVLLLPTIQVAKMELWNLPAMRTFINGSLGIQALHVQSFSNTWMAQARLFSNEDEYTLTEPEIRYAANGIWMHLFGEGFFRASFLGLAFHYQFGEPSWAPVIGGVIKTGERSSLIALLPFMLKWQHSNADHTFNWGLRTDITGGYNRYQSKLEFDTLNRVLMFRRSQFGGTAFVNWNLRGVRLTVSAGFTKQVSVRFTDASGSIIEPFRFTGDAVPLIRLRISFPLGNRADTETDMDLQDAGLSDW